MTNPDYKFFSKKYGTNIDNIEDSDTEYKKAKKYKENVEKSIKRPFRKKVKEVEKVDLERENYG